MLAVERHVASANDHVLNARSNLERVAANHDRFAILPASSVPILSAPKIRAALIVSALIASSLLRPHATDIAAWKGSRARFRSRRSRTRTSRPPSRAGPRPGRWPHGTCLRPAASRGSCSRITGTSCLQQLGSRRRRRARITMVSPCRSAHAMAWRMASSLPACTNGAFLRDDGNQRLEAPVHLTGRGFALRTRARSAAVELGTDPAPPPAPRRLVRLRRPAPRQRQGSSARARSPGAPGFFPRPAVEIHQRHVTG